MQTNTNDLNSKILHNKKIFFIIYIMILVVISLAYLIYASYNLQWLTGLILFLPLYYLGFKKHIAYKEMKNMLKLKNQWGNKLKRKRKFEDIRKLFEFIKNEGKTYEEKIYIDDQTWQDLNMNEIFADIDHTLSNPGEKVLYNILRNPLFNKKEIKRRDKIIKYFQNNEKLREKTGLKLLQLGRRKNSNLLQLLWGKIPSPTPYGIVLNLLALTSLCVLGSFYFWGVKSLFLLVIMMAINAGVRKLFKKKFFDRLPANTIDYLGSIIQTAEDLSSLEVNGIENYQNELKSLSEKFQKLKSKMYSFVPKKVKSEADYIFEYFNILFLLDVRNFNSSLKEINEHYGELRKIYMLIGEIDALRSAASYRDSLNYYTFPELSRDNKNNLEIKEAYHPLLEDSVANSLKLNNKGMIITGSNMAGKSTFLRTIGLNNLLAQTIATCPAREYKGTMFNILTSISRTDNILEGKSFYFSEAERLLQLINSIEDNVPSLCIIDELLSGTNSLERFHAAHEILDYLNKNDVLTIAATHDLNLADSLEHKFNCYHFNDNVTEDGLNFDYKLKKGTAVNGNAIKLLQYLGYPEEITEKAFNKMGVNTVK